MAGTNQFPPFAVGGSANVVTQAAYAALTALIDSGFVDGVAESALVNKVLRQAVFGTAAIAKIISDANLNALDDGSLENFCNAFRGALQSSGYLIANAGGTANAITGSYTPGITALTNGMILYVRAGSANTTTTPTFTPNSGTIAAKTIVKGAGAALVAGDIAGVGHWIELQYDLTLDNWALLNPATGVSSTTIQDATTTLKGKVALATSAEVTTGTDAAKAVTPAALAAAGVVAIPDATTSVKGKAALATSAEVTTGTDAVKVITPAALKNATLVQASIGFGQTYQDVTASRALATTYTNTLARPIVVSVDFTIPTTAQLTGNVAGVAVAWSNSQQSGNPTGLQFVVPPGATYSITINTGSPTLLKWFELK